MRTTRQNRVQSMTTMAVMTECSPVPRIATSRIDSSTGGNAIHTSTSQEMIRIDDPAEKAGEQSEQRADQAGEPGSDERHRQRHPRAEDHPREHVATEPVGAEQKARLGVGKADRRHRRLEQILRQRILRRDPRRAEREDDQKHDEAAGDHHFTVAQQPIDDRRRPRAALRRRW